eukprot:1147766-Pelagomonas_calceolata.AAC.4
MHLRHTGKHTHARTCTCTRVYMCRSSNACPSPFLLRSRGSSGRYCDATSCDKDEAFRSEGVDGNSDEDSDGGSGLQPEAVRLAEGKSPSASLIAASQRACSEQHAHAIALEQDASARDRSQPWRSRRWGVLRR